MTEPTYTHYGPTEALPLLPELHHVYAIVFAEPPYDEGPDMAAKFNDWFTAEVEKPGFELVTAHDEGELTGFAYGYTMPARDWWRRVDTAAPPEVKAAEKFAVMEWAVLPAHRGRGIGNRLMRELLAHRTEPWATLTVNPDAAARGMYERAGWRHVATTQPWNVPAMDVMTLPLTGA